ncbi:MAG TPA: 23S rRNA (adenine(2030)-N(6))-methyltransferase RlmJ [Pelagibacterium sp.]|uniref:23S rRNA (adenine(2030)-N(6))-methyltransferase RlmJ n=1 Tax=uncultured Pelagibacterium sp. TaxID=1159875 RepID=UPI000C660F14|nr:23S rRNA (adenine(2030)-N(6))-methyltransferase RlmJ [Pelagibacterium sp.]HCO54623.1 23S rRNA (adenine(2030)-N(6))-methyltransferase RlmJ [Pelagibacterium sp.]|tara:strand:- start:4505 stop:5356 length:852 start_codon:yes stop_codon:yes gene_type:complete
MNYRHAFHAGNFADVVKHIILTRILAYLMRKEAAFRVIDTHAGVGLYDLLGDEAGRTGEWREGIARLMAAELPEPVAGLVAPYLAAVAAQNSDGQLRHYPGSPFITRHMLRDQDRLMALELHPADAEALRENFAGDIQTRVTQLDGWAAIGTHLPPKEKRGLVLVDPPFEVKGEFERMTQALVKAHARWPGGTYAFWYPIKDPRDVQSYAKALRATSIAKILRLELTIRLPSTPPRLHGTGMVVVNPPFVLEEEMRTLLPILAGLLADEGRGRFHIEWIRGEG